MATKTFSDTTSGGSWETATNWNLAGVPGSGDEALIDLPGTYVVTLGSIESPNSVTLNDATATLTIAAGGQLLESPLTLNAGTLALDGLIQGSTIVANGGTFAGLGGTLEGVTWQGPLGGSATGGTTVNIKDGITLLNLAGTGPGTLDINTLYQVYVLDSTPLSNMTINFGTYNNEYLYGSFTGPMVFATTTSVNQSTSEYGATINGLTLINNGTISASGSATTMFISPGFTNTGTLLVSGGDSVTLASSLENSGTVAVSGTGKLTISDGSVPLSNSSTITVSSSGSLVVSGSLTGNGVITVASFGVLDMFNTTNTETFLDGKGTLRLEAPGSFTAEITGFEKGDQLDLLKTPVTKVSYAGTSGSGVLTVMNGTTTEAALNLVGNYTTDTFGFTPDNGTGNIITVTGTVSAARTLSWTGATSTAFGTAANWDDLTDGLNPATKAPVATDTVEFNGSSGGISGSGTVSTIIVGSVNGGVLNLSGGATLVANSLDAGVIASAIGQVGLTGAGTDLTVSGSATVADDGTGVLSILSGATFTGANLTIGNLSDSSGAMVVSGTGSRVDLSGALNIGTALGTGDLTVGPGASVVAGVVNLQGDVVLEGGFLDPTVYIENSGSTTSGFGTVGADYLVLEGTIISNGTKPNKETEVVLGTVVGGGTLAITGGTTADGTAVNGPGILQIGTHDTIELTGAVLNAASTTFTDTQTPTGTYTVTDSVIDVVFQDTTGVLLLDDIAGFGGTVATYHPGDSFVITGGTLSNLGVSNGDTLTLSDTGSHAGAGGIDQIIFGSSVSAAGFNIVNGDTVQAVVACFAKGTRIETVDGLVAVEDLAVGDRVVTVDGSCDRIVWIGQRLVNCERHPNPETVWPVRVRAGAFGGNVPERDLYLSPDHAVFVNDVLVPVKLLIDGSGVAQVKRAAVTYYHVELSRHAVVLAEGLPAESYLDLRDRADFDNGGESVRLFPGLAARLQPAAAIIWESRAAAPLVQAGEALASARRTVAANATGRGSLPMGRALRAG